MIALTKLNGRNVIVNAELIKMIEHTPDTLITLTTGETIVVDEAYVRESIDDPYANVREGLASDMASYEGRLSEQDYADFIAFLKTLR